MTTDPTALPPIEEPGITVPAVVPMPEQPKPAETAKRGAHLIKENPKIVQFTGRATTKEADRINDLIEVQSAVTGTKKDIVRVTLDMMDHIEKDIFQTYKTKKKK